MRRERAVVLRWAGVGLVCAISVVLLFRPHQDVAWPATVAPRADVVAATIEVETEVRRERVPSSPAIERADRRTAREILEQLNGVLTEGIEAELRADGVDLDAIVAVPDWETVEERFRTALADFTEEQRRQQIESMTSWPSTLTAEVLKTRYPIIRDRGLEVGPFELAEIEDLVRDTNLEMEARSEVFCDGMAAALRTEWARRGYQRSPISTLVLPRSRRPAFYAASSATDGWAAKIQLFQEDYPEVAAELNHVARLRRNRERAVVRYLASLR